MIGQITKGTILIVLIILGFIVLLLLPREIKITHVHYLVYTADYPFTLGLYKENIRDFFQHFQSEKGFGLTKTGVTILDEVWTLLGRSLLIVLPCFILSIGMGTLFGVLQFYYREKFFGKVLSVFTWVFSSIPDFFLYIAVQYLLIILIKLGLPHFSLYGQDHWYSFILPLLALTLYPFIHISKFISTSLSNEVGQEYVRTSYAKGLVSRQVLLHMLKNCLPGLMNQTQVVMVYILTSLPIIEKLSSYRGAGSELLESILGNEDVKALAYMIPFLFIMFITIVSIDLLKRRLFPQFGGERS